jgi:hypothetical protein
LEEQPSGLRAHGVDRIDVSTGGKASVVRIPVGLIT